MAFNRDLEALPDDLENISWNRLRNLKKNSFELLAALEACSLNMVKCENVYPLETVVRLRKHLQARLAAEQTKTVSFKCSFST